MLRDFPPSISSDDIIHLRGLSFNALVALSTIGAARDAIGLSMGLEQQASRQMANGAKPNFALLVKKALTEAAAKRLKQQFNDVAGGINNTGATVILEEGIEPKPLQMTSVDLEFMAQRNFSIPDVARFYKVPPHKLGNEVLRGINIDQVNQDYVNNTVMPDLHRFEQKLADYFALDAEDIDVDMDEKVLLRADATAPHRQALRPHLDQRISRRRGSAAGSRRRRDHAAGRDAAGQRHRRRGARARRNRIMNLKFASGSIVADSALGDRQIRVVANSGKSDRVKDVLVGQGLQARQLSRESDRLG